MQQTIDSPAGAPVIANLLAPTQDYVGQITKVILLEKGPVDVKSDTVKIHLSNGKQKVVAVTSPKMLNREFGDDLQLLVGQIIECTLEKQIPNVTSYYDKKTNTYIKHTSPGFGIRDIEFVDPSVYPALLQVFGKNLLKKADADQEDLDDFVQTRATQVRNVPTFTPFRKAAVVETVTEEVIDPLAVNKPLTAAQRKAAEQALKDA
jgi:hypothetical protein